MLRCTIGLFFAAAICAAIPSTAATTVAKWTYETSVPTTSGPHAAEIGTGTSLAYNQFGDDTQYSNSVGNGSAESFSVNSWSYDDYFQFDLSTESFYDLAISWDQTRSSSGPGNFRLQYSHDGTNYLEVPALPNYSVQSVVWNSNSPDPSHSTSYNVDLSGLWELNDRSNVSFRLVASENSATPTGTTRIDNVEISGSFENPLRWDFEDADPQSGLPPGWTRTNRRFGNWWSGDSRLQTGSGNVLGASFYPPDVRILWYDDESDFDSLESVMSSLPNYLDKSESAESPADFADRLTHGESWGQYDLAIFLQQDGESSASDYSAAFNALSNFVANGGRAIVSDSSRSAIHAASFGANYRQSNSAQFSITNTELAAGMTQPVDVDGCDCWSLVPTTGVSVAEFANSQGSAIVVGNNGRSIINSFSATSVGSGIYDKEIEYLLAPVLAQRNGAPLGSGGVASEEILVESDSQSFRIPGPASASLSFDANVSVNDQFGGYSIEVLLVSNLNGQGWTDAAQLWQYPGFGDTHTGTVVIPSPDQNSGQNPLENLDPNTTYRLRVRVRDNDTNLSTLDRTEIDNIVFRGAVLVGVTGDYNDDGSVDAADYTLWRNSLGSPGSVLQNRDSNVTGPVSTADYVAWKIHYGNPVGASASGSGGLAQVPVPEPATALHFVGTLLATLLTVRARGAKR